MGDLAYNFWEKYCKADILERHKILQNTGLVKSRELAKSDLTDEQYEQTILTMFMSYLDDLINYMETKDNR